MARPALRASGDPSSAASGSQVAAAEHRLPQLALAEGHSCALRADGTAVRCWGANSHGAAPEVRRPGEAGTVFLSVSTSSRATCAVRSDGAVECWGALPGGRSSHVLQPPTVPRSPLTTGLQLAGVRYVRAFALAKDVCGWRSDGRVDCLATVFSSSYPTPPTIHPIFDARSVRTCRETALLPLPMEQAFLSMHCEDVDVQCSVVPAVPGATPVGIARCDTLGRRTSPALELPGGVVWDSLGGANYQSFYGLAGGRLWSPPGTTVLPTLGPAGWTDPAMPGTRFVQVASAGEYLVSRACDPTGGGAAGCSSILVLGLSRGHKCALRDDGVIECWGNDVWGEARRLRVPLSKAVPYRQFATALYHTCAIRTDSVVECWGRNDHGEAPNVVHLAEPQTIGFTATLPNSAPAGSAFAVGARATSGLPVTLATSDPAVCVLVKGTLQLVKSGVCEVTADQAGSGDYRPAPRVQQVVQVLAPASPTPSVIQLSGLSQVADGTPKRVTVTTTPAGLLHLVTYDGGTTVPSAPGSYAVVATVLDPAYPGRAEGTLVIVAPKPKP